MNINLSPEIILDKILQDNPNLTLGQSMTSPKQVIDGVQFFAHARLLTVTDEKWILPEKFQSAVIYPFKMLEILGGKMDPSSTNPDDNTILIRYGLKITS